MSWLFCCGDNSHKKLESRNTIDLTRQSAIEKQERVAFKTADLDDLAGNQSAQSDLLNNIISNQKIVRERSWERV